MLTAHYEVSEMPPDTTPPSPRAKQLRELLEAYGRQLAAQDSTFGPILTASVHQNYAAAVDDVIAKLVEAKKPHLPAEEFQSAARGIAAMAIRREIGRLFQVGSACESPAELLLVIALDTVCKARVLPLFYELPSDAWDSNLTIADLLDQAEDGAKTAVLIKPQADIGGGSEPTYRADFLIKCAKMTGDEAIPVKITTMAVEVDGRSHAADESRIHDSERDRYFRSKGIVTDRYAGKQVYDDPFGCATKIVDQLVLQ